MLIDELFAGVTLEHGALREVLVDPDMRAIVEERGLHLGGRRVELSDGGELDRPGVFAHVHFDAVVSTDRDVRGLDHRE